MRRFAGTPAQYACLWLVLLPLLLCCQSRKGVESHSSTHSPAANMKRIQYTDFNNNLFDILPHSLTYKAIKAAQSSSGIYSGGEDRNLELPEGVFEQIVHKARAIAADTSLHLSQRRMLTAILLLEEEAASRRYIIGRSPAQAELEALLQTLISKE